MGKRSRKRTDEHAIGACTMCGEIVHFFRYTTRPVEYVLETRKCITNTFGFSVDRESNRTTGCPACHGVAVFPKDQDVLVAAFLVGGFQAVVADMFADVNVRAMLIAKEDTHAVNEINLDFDFDVEL